MVREMLEKLDEKEQKTLEHDRGAKQTIKVCLLGLAEGVIDALTYCGGVLLALILVENIINCIRGKRKNK